MEEHEKKKKTVNFGKLFSFASNEDLVLIFTSFVAATLNGMCLPIAMILFGQLINFIVYEAALSSNGTLPYNSTSKCGIIRPQVIFISRGDMDETVIFGVGTLISGLASTFLHFVFISCITISSENQVFRLRSAIVKQIFIQDMSWHDSKKTTGLAVRISEDLKKIQDGIGEKLGHFFSYCSIVFFSFLAAFYYGWELALITLIALPILILAAGILAKVQTSLSTQESKAYAKAGALAEEVIGSIKTVTIFNAQENEAQRFEDSLHPATQAGIKRGLGGAIGTGLVWTMTYATYALSFWYGIRLAAGSTCEDGASRKYDAGTISIVFFNMLYAALRLGKILPFIETFSEAKTAASSVFELLESKPLIDSSSTEGLQLKDIDGFIELDNVDFSYPSRPDVAILNGISFRVEAGSTVALVGHSGCGKSTCIQLLQRFYDPGRGRITVDGHDIKNFNVRWWREKIGVVGQEPVLFSLTIRDNILLGHPRSEEVSNEEIEKAARQANAHDFIMSLPRGYDTFVGERGANLSGGQKQRIAIARALIRNPRILLFDEATSALDNQSEAVVQLALDQARQGRTTIIVAHRLTTIQNADLIFVFQNGLIEEKGNHSTLIEQKGLYYELVQSQERISALDYTDDQIYNDLTDENASVSTLFHEGSTRNSLKNRSLDGSHANLLLTAEKEKQVDVMTKIFKMNKPEWAYLLLGVIGAFIHGLSTPIYAIVFGEIMGILDPTLEEDVHHLNNILALMFLGLGFGTGLGAFLQGYMLTVAGERLTFRLRVLTFRSILQQKIGWFDFHENSVGSLSFRLSNDTSAIQGATGARIGLLVQVFVSIFFALFLCFFWNWKLALAVCPCVPIVLISSMMVVKMSTGQATEKEKALDKSSRIGTEAMSNIHTVITFGLEEKIHTRYMDSLHEPLAQAKKVSLVRGLTFGVTSNVPIVSSIVVLCYGTYLVQNESFAYKEVFKSCEALVFGMEMVGHTLAFTPNYERAKSAAKHIFQLIEGKLRNDTKLETKEKLVKNKLKGQVEFDNVHFSYPTRANFPVLRGLSSKIPAGKTVALVGHSGCGKSTVIQLLQRFYDPDSGRVLADSKDIRNIGEESFRFRIGIVSQEPNLFNRTIAENIAYGDQTRYTPMEEIIEAAKSANIHNFVQSLPLGYDTVVGPRGSQLSGGQKQRVAIARALIRNPQILLLDEATSALDAESEKVVQEALDRACQDRTCIIIAHRLSSVKNADFILVVDQGRIKEEGTHESLLKLKGFYHELWNVQAKNS